MLDYIITFFASAVVVCVGVFFCTFCVWGTCFLVSSLIRKDF